MKTILVSGASGVVGYGILRSLRASKLGLRLIGTSIYDESAANCFSDIFVKAPPTNDVTYMDWLLKTIETYKIDLIIPGIEADTYKWFTIRYRILASGAKMVENNTMLTALCQNKWDFYIAMQDNPYVIKSSLSDDFEYLSNEFDLPFLLKPANGFGSKGIRRIHSLEEFEKSKDSDTLLIAQPIIGSDDEEYTVAAFGDGLGGFTNFISMKRTLSKDGFTDKAAVATPDGMEKAIHELCLKFKPLGPTNFQFRKNHAGRLKLLEINPRISSSTSIRTLFGYNECEMAVNFYLNNILPDQPAIKSGTAIRYVEDKLLENS